MSYRIVGRLGRGGMGVVDLAVDEHGRHFALKRLSLHGTPVEMDKARQRVRREVEVLRSLDHPAIVRLRDVYDDGDDLVLVMDYLSGGNLASRVMEGGPLPLAQIRAIADRLLDALAYAHRMGIVHRDIKPANVLFDENGLAYLVDFGAATHRDATPGLTATEMVVGTPGFMAPEQARGEPATAASDVFSLGATLAFAASGEGPFGTADPRVLMLRAASGKTLPLAAPLVGDLRRRISRMLDKDPARRPTAAEARGGTDGTSPRAIADRRLSPTARSWWIAGIVALLTIAVIVGAVLSTRGDDKRGDTPASTSTTPPASTSSTEACVPLKYQPCGKEPAPNTNGEVCNEGFDDYDDNVANGCEAVPDDVADGTELTSGNPIRANLVPRDDVDTFRRPVEDRFNMLGNGELHIKLTAPADALVRLTVLDSSGNELASDVVDKGKSREFSFTEPSVGGDDSTVFTVKVEYADGGTNPAAGYYELTTRGQY